MRHLDRYDKFFAVLDFMDGAYEKSLIGTIHYSGSGESRI